MRLANQKKLYELAEDCYILSKRLEISKLE